MKNKTLTAFLAMALLAIHISAFSQEFKIKMNSGTLKFTEIKNLKISQTTGSEVILRTEGKSEMPERAKGLKPIGADGSFDNTGLGLSVKDGEGGKEITSISLNGEGVILAEVPKGIKIHITQSGTHTGILEVNGFTEEVTADLRYQSIRLEDVTGPVVINSIYGNIDALFSSISNQAMSLVSIYGAVDIAVPASAKANFKLKSIYGNIYTDLDLKINANEGDGMKSLKSKELTGTFNGGGTPISLEARYGNIYLRKR